MQLPIDPPSEFGPPKSADPTNSEQSMDLPSGESQLALIYAELRALAAGYLAGERAGHTLQPTALVHEAYLRLAHQKSNAWKDSQHFCALAAVVMRRVLVDHARRRLAAKRGAGQERVTLSGLASPNDQEYDMLALDEALEELHSLNPRHARVIELRFFGGLTLDQVAEELMIARSTVAADWQMSRAWLNHRLSVS